jgi:hypothetical protein
MRTVSSWHWQARVGRKRGKGGRKVLEVDGRTGQKCAQVGRERLERCELGRERGIAVAERRRDLQRTCRRLQPRHKRGRHLALVRRLRSARAPHLHACGRVAHACRVP